MTSQGEFQFSKGSVRTARLTHPSDEIFISAVDMRVKLNTAQKYAMRTRSVEMECGLNTRSRDANMVVQLHAEGNKVRGRETIEHSSHTYGGNVVCVETHRNGID
jgi:hypothetical protein